jgi:adenylyl-sulfate kinase
MVDGQGYYLGLINLKPKSIYRCYLDSKLMKKVLWFTGLSGSGKTTIANKLKEKLDSKSIFNKSVLILDGDVVREKMHKHLGFSREDIRENNRLIAEIAKKELNNYDLIIVPIISPYKGDRLMAKDILSGFFVEIFINASLKECIRRDVKGLYKKALAGEITNFIGVDKSTPYEVPENPDISINTLELTEEEAVEKIYSEINR